ncbi:MAG: flagellar hook-basal body complex protein [Ruminococcus sp.]|nr:flagellar hook-basal body complex protein [Ruminococcus sp.]
MVRSLYSGVSGLKSHQTRMDVIGNNIANVNTYGFKASRTAFADIYYQYQRTETGGTATRAGNNSSQVGYGVEVKSIDKNMEISNFQTTSRTFDIAIAGDGFFICGTMDRNKQIDSVRYTRMGNFGIDSAGNLVNSSNQFILGTVNRSRLDGGDYSSTYMEDEEPADNPNDLDQININDLVWDAFKPECQMDYDDVPPKYLPSDDEDANPTIFSGVNPYDATQQIAYDYHLKEGEEGFEIKGDSDLLAAIASGEQEDTEEALQVQQDYILYSVNGKYVNGQGVEYDPDTGHYLDEKGNHYLYTCNNYVENGNLRKEHVYTLLTPEVDETTGELTYPDEPDEGATVYTYNPTNKNYEATDARGNTIYADMTDGSLKYSDLDAFSIGQDGVLAAQYASQIRSLARIELATFDNVEGLSEVGGTQFIQTTASGTANIKRPGDAGAGSTQSGKLEMSNVNLADEFSDMVVTQRGFQANARIITTSDSMLEELVNLKR